MQFLLAEPIFTSLNQFLLAEPIFTRLTLVLRASGFWRRLNCQISVAENDGYHCYIFYINTSNQLL